MDDFHPLSGLLVSINHLQPGSRKGKSDAGEREILVLKLHWQMMPY